jgi:hypothetical protein
MRANLETELRGVDADHFINAVRRDRIVELSGAVVADRAEQRTIFIGAMRQIPRLAAFAGHLEVRHAFTGVLRVFHLELCIAPRAAAHETAGWRGWRGRACS